MIFLGGYKFLHIIHIYIYIYHSILYVMYLQLMKNSVLTAGLEKKDALPPYEESLNQLRKQKQVSLIGGINILECNVNNQI